MNYAGVEREFARVSVQTHRIVSYTLANFVFDDFQSHEANFTEGGASECLGMEVMILGRGVSLGNVLYSD